MISTISAFARSTSVSGASKINCRVLVATWLFLIGLDEGARQSRHGALDDVRRSSLDGRVDGGPPEKFLTLGFLSLMPRTWQRRPSVVT